MSTRCCAIEPFRSIDASAFPPSLPLRGILLGDTRIGRYQAGDMIVREGDYGHSAFLVLAGTVRVVLERLDPKLLGRDEPPRRSWRQAIAQLWQNSRLPEVRRAYGPPMMIQRRRSARGKKTARRECFCRTCRGCWSTPARCNLGRARSSASWRRWRARRGRPP